MLGSGRRRRNRVGVLMLLVALAIPTVGVAPAHALAPTVAAFLPLSGAPGTSVTITGFAFDDTSTVNAVSFNGTAGTFTVDSTSQITATVPVGATTGAVSVTDSEGTGSSALPFTITGPAAPVVVSFLPLTGPVGTPVTITGTGFTGATSVKFNGTSATFAVGSATQITTTVPSGATTGTISITTPGGTGVSLLPFTVTAGAASTRNRRSLTLRFGGRRVARGRVSSADGFVPCVTGVPIKIQRRGHDGWKTVASIRTKSTGRFARPTSRPGTYRAVAPRVTLNGGTDICGRSVSPPRHRG
jgi:hypothetical protein